MNPGNPLGDLGRVLLVLGLVLAGVGVLLIIGGRLPFRLGRLPGDISYQAHSGSGFYFPIVTCILSSAAATLILWIVNYFRR